MVITVLIGPFMALYKRLKPFSVVHLRLQNYLIGMSWTETARMKLLDFIKKKKTQTENKGHGLHLKKSTSRAKRNKRIPVRNALLNKTPLWTKM